MAAEAAAVRLENDAPRLLVCAPSNIAGALSFFLSFSFFLFQQY
jgi:hypothetical protein